MAKVLPFTVNRPGRRPYPLALPSLPQLDIAIEALIELRNALDGDADVEPNGDELDGENAEDSFGPPPGNVAAWAGPGCPIADPDMAVDDIGCDPEQAV